MAGRNTAGKARATTKSKRPPVSREKAPRRTGRLPVDVDVELLRRLAGINCSYEEIAAVSEVSVDTLTRRFADVIEKERAAGRVNLRRSQWSMALGRPIRFDEEGRIIDKGLPPNPTMQIWLGKQELGQKDVNRLQHEDPNGDPLPTEFRVRLVRSPDGK